jgi:N-acyl-D-aspartate/D-glutamate deacylase
VPSLLFIRLRGWYSLLRFSTHAEILAAFKDSDKRAELMAEAAPMDGLWKSLILRQVKTEANKQYLGMNLADIGSKRGSSALDAMIDISIEEELEAHFLSENMGHNNTDKVGELLKHPNVHVGASDGGAHILSFATFGDTGYLFSEFVRETGLLGLEEAVKKITHDTAKIWGMENRGLIQNGYQADITIFDAGAIARGAEYFVQDVPGDGNRYVRDAIGIQSVIINGAIAYEHSTGYTENHRGQIIAGQGH